MFLFVTVHDKSTTAQGHIFVWGVYTVSKHTFIAVLSDVHVTNIIIRLNQTNIDSTVC